MSATIEEPVWEFMQGHLGYSDEEMKSFRANPKNAELIAKGMQMMNKEIVFRVIESKGCHSGLKPGDIFCFDAYANLITGKSPAKICIHALEAGACFLYAACELLYHDVDPDKMRYKRFGCLDVGLQCGGWGKVVMEIEVRDVQA